MSFYNIYFSPTGGTRKVADAVSGAWGDQVKNIDIMKPAEHRFFQSGDVCLFSVPSYGGRIPSVTVDRIRELSGNGAKAILNVVFGNRAIDDTLLELSDEVRKVGFVPVAAMEAVAQHSLMPQYGAGRPDDSDLRELHEFAARIKKAIEEGTYSTDLKLPGNRPYKEYKGVPLKPSAGNGCIGCGLCAEQCPTGAIPMNNFRFTDTSKCISCMHCVTVCPKNVRKVNKLVAFVAGKKMKKVCSGRKENKLYL